jgi:TonB family protein
MPVPTKQATRTGPQTGPISGTVPIGVLEVPVGVWGSRRPASILDPSRQIDVFAEETCTVIVSPRGAVIRLSAAVDPDQIMMIANRKSGQVMPCRVVKVRSFPNAKGYAEIEFLQAANGFWGSYVQQGTMKLKGAASAALEGATKPDTGTTGREPMQTSISTSDGAPHQTHALASTPSEGFWKGTLPKELISVRPNAASTRPNASQILRNRVALIESKASQIASAEKQTQRTAAVANPLESRFRTNKHSLNDGSWWLLCSSLGRQFVARTTAVRRASFSRRGIVFGWAAAAAVLIMGTTGFVLLRHDATQTAEAPLTDSTPVASLVSPSAQTMLSSQPESNSRSARPELPIAKTENFPGTQARELADRVHISRPPARKSTAEEKVPKEKLLAAPHFAANREAVPIGRDQPPDVIGADSNASASAIQGVLSAFLPRGGRVKEPRLISSSAPRYPATAKQAGIEGPVTIDAVIDTTGKLTSMTIVSGSPLLQQAALESLRTWKYEPGYLDEKPVSVRTSITVNFRLH